jgi:hypothetical protein
VPLKTIRRTVGMHFAVFCENYLSPGRRGDLELLSTWMETAGTLEWCREGMSGGFMGSGRRDRRYLKRTRTRMPMSDKLLKLAEKVSQMRKYQAQYFANRSPEALANAKRLEKEVDTLVRDVLDASKRSPLDQVKPR